MKVSIIVLNTRYELLISDIWTPILHMRLCSLLWIVDFKQMNWWSLLWKTSFIYDNVHNNVIVNYFMTPTMQVLKVTEKVSLWPRKSESNSLIPFIGSDIRKRFYTPTIGASKIGLNLKSKSWQYKKFHKCIFKYFVAFKVWKQY